MDSSAALPRQIQQALERGFTVVTANQRAARTLHHIFDLHQRALGLTHWEPPQILAWETWLISIWHRLLLDGHATDLLLNSTQEHTLWRAIIVADTAPDGAVLSLRPVDALAELAADAWRLLHDYRARRRLQAAIVNSDTRAFARWASEFDLRCTRAKYLTEAQLPETLRAVFAAGRLAPPTGLLLVGFDLRNPAQTALLGAIRAAGCDFEELELGSPAPSITLVDASDQRDEFSACARWLRAHLTRQPASRIAVIVPAIETNRAEIDRVFRQTLAPELNDISTPAGTSPYEFSLGIPLASTPMAATALDILRWATGPLPLDRVSALLLSPHFAAHRSPGASEYLARAEFDAFVLRRQHLLQPQISLDDLHSLVSNPKHGATNLPLILQRLSALRAIFPRIDRAERSHADWAAAFHELLDAAGWAASGRDSSTEFQTRRKWDGALDELASLDFDSAFDSRSNGTRVSFSDALAALARIASQTLFAPESRHAPIQIMGPLESAGSGFDALWFLGADDLAWPARPVPNPLLPWLLQRELAMPGADPTQDTSHARRITQRIAASAPTVLFSYAHQSIENGHQRPSPLITGLSATGLAVTSFSLEILGAHQIAPPEPASAPIQLEPLPDDAPIPPPPDRVLPGGASILQSQAACGFRAFAEKRLFASALEPSSLGLDPLQRGNLVHSVMEKFWTKVETQAALKLLTRDQRDTLLNQSIDEAFARDYFHPAAGWPRAYLNSERQRLLNLLGPWLDYEADKRPPFTVQTREEKLHDVQIGPLRLDIRIDRVDLALGEGNNIQPAGEIILDYKTGAARPADWLGERPDQPQLPLYAVVSTAAAVGKDAQNLAAVAFASVRLGKDMGLQGYQSRDGVLPKPAKLKAASLRSQVHEWRGVLTALAEDFYSGRASVDPKDYPNTCSHCDQRLLCRLNPVTLNVDAIDDGTDTDPNSSDSDSPEAARG
ncbi:MAG TPA: PD-(D/E)XK nuclease family protein [Acidobacteriaceae bacterium]|jgi:probable DNA repair protein|nr:PD-(D/E)XK nuclease family protein [Acidobacteriaceae bacterium]